MSHFVIVRTLPFIAALLLAASPLAAQDGRSDPRRAAAQRAHSILEETAQWADLFNGMDLTGFTGDTEGYAVEDGAIVCQEGGGFLYTEKDYGDFAFRFEFKLPESGNNGIGIRVPEGGRPSVDGMEIQVLDHNGPRYQTQVELGDGSQRTLSRLKPWQYHGSIYGVYPAATGYLKPPGEWNEQTIIAIDDHIVVILNGATILDAFLEDLTPPDGKEHPGMKNEKGRIVLAGHNDRVEFRRLQVADYSAPPTSPVTDADNAAPEGFHLLFNGRDLSGWKGPVHGNANERRALKGKALQEAQAQADESMRQHWSVVDGVLTYDGKGQSLCTAKDYGDFELYVDWKIPPGADSGIYLRGTPQVQIWDPWDARVRSGEEPATAEQWVAAYSTGRNLGSGGLWNNRRWRNVPLTLADNKPGEWNTFLIRMVGDKVTIWLNDKLIVDRVALENYWDRSGQTPLPRADQIELQHHGSELFFKNVYIRELPY